MFTNNAFRAISQYGKEYLLGGQSSEDGFQDQQPRVMELEGLRLILGGGLLMRKFWAKEEQSAALKAVLKQEELDGVSETEAVISGKDPLLSGEEEQLLLPAGTGSVVSNRDVQVQVQTEHLISNTDIDVQVQTEHISNRGVEVQAETGPLSNTDVTVQTDGDTEIEDLRRKNEDMANELANKQDVIEGHENQIADYYQSIQELKAELKMAQQKNYVQNQMQSAFVRDKEALKQELEDKVTVDEENTMKIERSFLNKELALEQIKLQKDLMEARANDQKRRQEHQSLVEELQGEISKALVQNHQLKEAVFTITKKNEGLREQLENKNKREKNLNGKIVRMTNKEDEIKKELSAANDVISSLKKELQK
ncbi:coiled-coil domain-containing protein 102A-like [Palaemon carinicauda]|uniref:coiled-coil domain-containing protein 102A-like n=1 Tax=Palaemon carinicauda TaxID=392227 RepID=UPI0035B6822E